MNTAIITRFAKAKDIPSFLVRNPNPESKEAKTMQLVSPSVKYLNRKIKDIVTKNVKVRSA